MGEYEPVGIGIMGTGSQANGLAEALAGTGKLRLVSCYNPRTEAAAEFARAHSCKASSLEELRQDADVEAVLICSPNSAHRENAIAAASAGKHVFVDKPIANSIQDALAIIEACQEHGLVLMVGHDRRRMGGHRKMKEMISAGEIGKPIAAEANFSLHHGLQLRLPNWRASRVTCPGMPLMQLGIHLIDTLQYLLGDIAEVSSYMSHLAIPVDNDDVTVSILKFESGVLGYLGSNIAHPRVHRVSVYGTEGNLTSDDGGPVRIRKGDAKPWEEVPTPSRDGWKEQLEEFADCVRSGGKPETDGEAGLKALAVVRAAIESNELRRPVTIREAIVTALPME